MTTLEVKPLSAEELKAFGRGKLSKVYGGHTVRRLLVTIAKIQADNKRLREALIRIADTDTMFVDKDTCVSFYRETATAALGDKS